MFKQLRYEWKGRGLVRGLTLGLFLGVTLLLLLIGFQTGKGGLFPAVSVVGVVFSCIGFVALLVVATVLAVDSSNRLFIKPRAYFTWLTPARGWEVVGSRVLISLIDYMAAFLLGIWMILLQVHVLLEAGGWADVSVVFALPAVREVLAAVKFVVGILKYLLLFLFARTMIHTVFAGISARWLLGVLVFIGVQAVWGLIDRLVMPGSFFHAQSMLSVSLYILVSAIRLAALFVPTALLLEKKLNL